MEATHAQLHARIEKTEVEQRNGNWRAFWSKRLIGVAAVGDGINVVLLGASRGGRPASTTHRPPQLKDELSLLHSRIKATSSIEQAAHG